MKGRTRKLYEPGHQLNDHYLVASFYKFWWRGRIFRGGCTILSYFCCPVNKADISARFHNCLTMGTTTNFICTPKIVVSIKKMPKYPGLTVQASTARERSTDGSPGDNVRRVTGLPSPWNKVITSAQRYRRTKRYTKDAPPASLSKTPRLQICCLSPSNSCCQGLLSVSPFTFFPPYQAERDPHPALDAERRLLSSGGAAVGLGGATGEEVMSSLPP